MNTRRYIYVSPQQYVKIFDEWRYEYFLDGRIRFSPTFKFHQGQDTFKKIEQIAWKAQKVIRKLSCFDWNRLLQETGTNAIVTEDGQRIDFYSRKQKERCQREMRANAVVKVIKQFSDGDIVLHHIFEDEGRLLGFVIIVGPRGGIRTEHGFSVVRNNGEPYLVRTIGNLFD